MIRLRRTIYIGVGGTGTGVLRQLKSSYTQGGKRKVPPMIGFLAVDSNKTDLDALKDFDVNEKFHLASGAANATMIYDTSKDKYRWLPEVNSQYLSCIDHYGANQIRSNGRFLFETSEVTAANPGAFSSMLRSIKDRITSAHDSDGVYVDAQNADIDVYLIFSICGGTGSGAFLPLAYRIKSTLGSCNLIGYGFSHSFFSSVGVRENIKPNAYAALLELDYCMQAERPEYQIINFPNNEKIKKIPFDSFMYVDTNTYTRNNGVHSLTRLLKEVKDTVVNALLLSAGTVGAENKSILSNLNALMRGAAGNIPCTQGGHKRAWVSSVGTSELVCELDADRSKLANKIAKDQMDILKKGPSAFDYAKWAKTLYNDILHINEGGDKEDGDNDDLINAMLNPTECYELHPSDVSVTDSGDYDTTELDKVKSSKLNLMDVNKNSKKNECASDLRQYIISSLFPVTSVSHTSYGVDNVRTALDVFTNKIKDFKSQLSTEIDDLKSSLREKDKNIEAAKEDIQRIGTFTINADAKRSQKKSEIAILVKDKAVIDLEISRREKALEVYSDVLALTGRYITNLAALSDKINSAIVKISAQNVDNDKSSEAVERESIFIDLTPYAKSLASESKGTNYSISDWHKFYSEALSHMSIEELSEMSSWDECFKTYIKKQIPTQTSPIILRALTKRLEEENELKATGEYDEARSYINKVVDMARPLMDIDNYGNLDAVRTNLIRFVSLPATDDTDLLKQVKTAFKTNLGNDVEFITHANENRIIVYQQMGVFSPYYIKGIAEIGTDTESCEYKFRQLASTVYTPFIDKEFIKVIQKNGHSLDQQIGSNSDEDMVRWVKAIMLGIISRGGNSNEYRVESEDGELDIVDDRFWKSFGNNRRQAYAAFCATSTDFKKEVDDEIRKRLGNPEYSEVFDRIRNAGKDVSREYTKIRLLDSTSEEFALTENQNQIREEVNCIRNL